MDFAERLNDVSTKSYELLHLPTYHPPPGAPHLPAPVDLLDVSAIRTFDPLYPALRREALAVTPAAIERRWQANQLLRRNGIRQDRLPEWDWVRFVVMKRAQQNAFMEEWHRTRGPWKKEGGMGVTGPSGSSRAGLIDAAAPIRRPMRDAAAAAAAGSGGQRAGADAAMDELARQTSCLRVQEEGSGPVDGERPPQDEEPPSYEDAMKMEARPPVYEQ